LRESLKSSSLTGSGIKKTKMSIVEAKDKMTKIILKMVRQHSMQK
jgi:hypothetical protein